MTGLATVAAGDCLYRKLVSGAYIPIRIDCHNGHIPSVLGGHIAFRIYSSNGLIAALPSNGLVRSILREHGCFDGVRVANGQNAFIGIQRNGLDCLTDGDLGLGLSVFGNDQHLAVHTGVLCRSSGVCHDGSGDGAFTNAYCGDITGLIHGRYRLIAAQVSKLDIGGVLGSHLSTQRLGSLTVEFQTQSFGGFYSGGENHDLDMGRGRNIGICNRYCDISLTGTDCSDQTSFINRGNLFVGGSPSKIQLGCCLCNLFLLGLVVGAILDIELLGLTLFQHNVGGQPH